MAHCPDGTIMALGDSIVQDMVTWKIGPFVEGFGVGGESLRRCLNRLQRGGLIHRAGAVILATGINELANFAYYGPYNADQITNNLAFMHSGLAAQATGKWVVRDILPVDEPVLVANLSSNYSGMNAKIDLANQRIRAAWANSSAQVQFVELKAQLVDSSGNLADSYHIDGMHLSRAGDDIQCASIKAALQRLPDMPGCSTPPRFRDSMR
jgi:lysophospholipase L1-like esterase